MKLVVDGAGPLGAPWDGVLKHPPTHHLALDESMLLVADESIGNDSIGSEDISSDEPGLDSERLRVWSFDDPVVVVGRSSRVDDEVHRDYCAKHQIPIERRSSGGASVVGGPGCLMYSVVVSHHRQPELKSIDAAHRYVMARVLGAIEKQQPDVCQQGICDLTWQNRKFSGNSLRISKHHLLYHGTILHGFDLELLAQCLNFAPRQPDYRDQRDHSEFVTNVPLQAERLASDLVAAFEADQTIDASDYEHRVAELRAQRYDQDAWRYRH